MALATFTPPGDPKDLSTKGKVAWSNDVRKLIDDEVAAAGSHAQFFNPLGVTLAADAATKEMRWGAFPRKLSAQPKPLRWQLADRRENQEEYCEWAAIRDTGGRIVRAMFTTEVPSFYVRLANDSPTKLLALYRKHVSPDVLLTDLIASNGAYRRDNKWNRLGAMHMIQGANTLNAAITLVAQATTVRTSKGALVTNANDLIRCGVNADPDRNSDPLIVGDVNSLARAGADITLADPIGLFIDNLQTTGWTSPDGTDPATFWKVTRGRPGFAVRAVFEVPAAKKYTVSDIRINGEPITSPAQIAQGIQVRVAGVAHRLGRPPSTTACGVSPAAHGGLESMAPADEPPTIEELLALGRSVRG